MSKKTYLENKNVEKFAEWLGQNLTSSTFAHQYLLRKSKQHWSCSSLADAFVQYQWRHSAISRLGIPAGTTFASNAAALAALQKDLRDGLIQIHADQAVCRAAIDVMKWGGVGPGNTSWLLTHEQGLAELLTRTRDALNAGDDQNALLTSKDLRFNAGMTKVYSLMCEDIIIYDSRVAAALGWAVVKFCKDKDLPSVPAELCFPWAPAKESKTQAQPKRRDPSIGKHQFPRLQSGVHHAEWNLKASWLLSDVLMRHSEKGSAFGQQKQSGGALRALEAALFMIGYELPALPNAGAGHPIPAASNMPQEPSSTQSPTEADTWIECHTKGKGGKSNAFLYRITGDGIKVKGGLKFSDAEINETFTRLWHHFGEKPFPLANDRDKVPNGTAAFGLGSAYSSATGKSPPYTSKLAAILQDLEVLLPAKSASSGSLHWTLNAQLLALGSSDSSVNIRTLLDEELDRGD